ncbi:hypothetical protein SNE40_000252 [Patella caerulea]|uniref:Target of rapamycin complex 2 subunit MAPKAP1 n=1 Tax=Patella caerulea TaxID=87958 RepID=A0AAN8KA34_PATCE
MAMMDNKDFLIAHLRNSFITSDDTGMCELILEGDEAEHTDGEEEFRRKKSEIGIKSKDEPPGGSVISSSSTDGSLFESSLCNSGPDFSDSESNHSFDIFLDMDYGAHRRRSNTAQRLDRLRKDKRNQPKAKTFTWKNGAVYKADEKGHLFERKDVATQKPVITNDSKKPSRLSQMIETIGDRKDNPFMDYARYDGKSSAGVATKRIDIYLTMLPPKERSYPMPVVVIATAKVYDLIGLICWQYTNENRSPKLNPKFEIYSLHIAEDDGEVDSDFPSLDNREPMSKFGFGKLALVERSPASITPRSLALVTIHIPNRGFNKFQVDDDNLPLREMMEKVLRRRKIKLRPGLKYNLEKLNDPGISVDLDATLMSLDTLEFVLIRENSARDDQDKYKNNISSDVAESLTSHQYKSYMVNLVHKIRTNTEVLLGVSGEKVEIDPISSKGSTRLFRQRAFTFDADQIADCHLLEQKSNGKSVLRLTYMLDSDFKHHDFEAEHSVSAEIVQKINHILELRLSSARKDFVTHQEKRLSMRRKDSFRHS